jgi:signal transduction histidine kinase
MPNATAPPPLDLTSLHLPEAGERPAFDLRTALRELRLDLGFETARLFVRSATGWDLMEHEGAERMWHPLLDPVTMEGTPSAAEYRDVRTLPGVGTRLAALGCASVATIPTPGGGRIVLDSATPSGAGGWIERSRPYLELIQLMGDEGSSLQAAHDAGTIRAVFTACQQAVAHAAATTDDLLDGIRHATGANEVFLLTERGRDVDVISSPPASFPRVLTRDAQAALAADPLGPALDGATLSTLAMALGTGAATVAGAFGTDRRDETLIFAHRQGPALSPGTLSVIARAVATTRAAIGQRDRTVTSRVEHERLRMASALHDGLVQTVAGAVMQLEGLQTKLERDPSEAAETLERSKLEIRRSLGELRAMLFDLHQGRRDEEPETLGRYVEDIVQRWRLPARVNVKGDLTRVPPATLSVAYVVIREALANAAKHSAASSVGVNLTVLPTELSVHVGDQGRGFSPDDEDLARREHHVGLELLRRRVHELGGTLRVESAPGKGTRVVARLPLQ